MGPKGRCLRCLACSGLLLYIPTCVFFLARLHWSKSPKDFPIHHHVFTDHKKSSLKFYDLDNINFFRTWINRTEVFCDGNIEIHAGKSVRLKGVVLVPDRAIAKGIGGESINDVINRNEADEFYRYSPGFYQLQCENEASNPLMHFIAMQGHHFKDWAIALDCLQQHPVSRNESMSRIPELTIAITRYEYANVYWVVMELYDAFLSAVFYGVSPNAANIIIMDAHPSSSLDELWNNTFNKFYRLSDLRHLTTFNEFVWNIPRKYSPFLSRPQIKFPLLSEFRDFILDSFNISSENNTISARCEEKKLKVLFIWRRDYVAHPRNPSGLIRRKIANEQEIFQAARAAFPGYDVTGVQLDSLSVREQLSLISRADFLIGMHGAALGFVPLMQKGTAVIELWPQNEGGNWHMQALALANSLHYRSWRNTNSRNENSQKSSTFIPKEVIEDLITKATKDVCFDSR